jgi:hypothetical protein
MSTLQPAEQTAADDSDPRCRRRVILVGASNLTLGVGTVLAAAHHAWGRRLEVHAALGYGRSFGRASRVLGRQLPAILDCGLWPQLAEKPAGSSVALVTDIGNDILYEQPVDRICEWVGTCLDRLAAIGARTAVTLLPLENLHSLSRARFTLLRSILVPRCRLSLDEASLRAAAVNEAVRQMAAQRGFSVVTPRSHWYGFDPIHIRRAKRGEAWREIVSAWSGRAAPARPRDGWPRTLDLHFRVPHRRRLWGIEQRGRQPAARYADGTTVALY